MLKFLEMNHQKM